MSLKLGLDISTSNVGWCIIEPTTNEMVSAGAVELKKKKSIFEKCKEVKKTLAQVNIDYDIGSISIEENLQAFRPGFSSAKTIVTLARFNGMVTLMCFDEFSLEPEFLNVNNARKTVGLKIDRKSEVSTKDQILVFVKQKEPNFTWPTRTLKSGVRKGLVIPADCCYDIADAYIIALASVCG
tara:strand:+ start:132 stop:677 length:546 start_codon:yes stop_codon:yes gene_type:complete